MNIILLKIYVERKLNKRVLFLVLMTYLLLKSEMKSHVNVFIPVLCLAHLWPLSSRRYPGRPLYSVHTIGALALGCPTHFYTALYHQQDLKETSRCQ